MQQVLILGAGYGGLLTALRLQPQIKNKTAQVTVVNAVDTFTERVRLHQIATGQRLKQYSIPTLLKGTGVNFVQDFVRHIDPQTQTVTLDHDVLSYDVLVVALGSRVNRTAIDGISDYAYTLDRQSASDLNQKLAHGGKLLVIGGGLTGVEATTEYAERDNIEVHLVTRGYVGEGSSDKGRDHIRTVLRKNKVTLHEQVTVTQLHADHADSNQGRLDYDVVLWAGGFCASPLAKDAGFTVNAQGQMLVRDSLQSVDYDNVYGVGDVASVMMQSGNTLRMACAVAMPMGAHGADNVSHYLNGDAQEAFQFAYMLQCISLGRRDGLVEFMQPDDTPKGNIITGRRGAWVKEIICRYTIWSLQLEKRFPGMYWYPKGVEAVGQVTPIPQI